MYRCVFWNPYWRHEKLAQDLLKKSIFYCHDWDLSTIVNLNPSGAVEIPFYRPFSLWPMIAKSTGQGQLHYIGKWCVYWNSYWRHKESVQEDLLKKSVFYCLNCCSVYRGFVNLESSGAVKLCFYRPFSLWPMITKSTGQGQRYYIARQVIYVLKSILKTQEISSRSQFSTTTAIAQFIEA